MADRVRIFDTTLRDGEQAAGVSFSAEEKLQIAKLLERMGVDCIEAGFAAASPADFDAVNRIAREVRGTQIASLCRAVPNDVDQGWEAIRDGENPRIHVFLSSSDIHIAHQLRKDRETVLQQAREDGRPGQEVRQRCRVLANGRDPLGRRFRPPDAARGD